jgi:tripartite-type tricarboxylate transporter receptor subunit TctC
MEWRGKAVIGKRLVQLVCAIAFGIAGMNPAAAQVYPSRPITIIVPYPPGGNTDIMGRALQVELSKSLGQTIIISNKGGASGTIGIRELLKAEPDGYTIVLTPNNPLTAQPHLQKLNYSIDSFRYVCLTYHTPYVLIAGPQAPFKTFAEFVKFAKAKPENLVYGTAGAASTPHLAMLAVLKAIGADGLAVPFQGEGPQSQALLSGTVMAIASTPAVAAASNLPVLAALSEERIATLPDVPTARELGFPAEAFTAGGLIAPGATPDDVVGVLEKTCAEAASTAEYRSIVERLNVTPRYLSGAAFRKLFESDSIRSREAIRRAGLDASR